ncbi:prepilin peptidase CpaA [Stenotrophomonas rhizophila]|uniref:A24 family peptidase n=1 Tax=Stenotrophomonas TaxID=40323 RepID=UPI000F4C8192|nr:MULTISPECIES: prepilin peptidase [Stenotrophomonas]MCW6026918.1 prepilin peptidase [Stenotrophomonas sp. SRS1]ROP80414.1 prepilin peptidase CpaA [Stenotrophomonas rhizophila]
MELLPLVALVLGVQVVINDLYARRVSNRGLLIASAAALVGLAWQWLGAARGFPATHLIGFALGLLSLLPFYAIGWMGAGDVKYFAVLGLLLGAAPLLPIWIVASLLAGAHAVCVIVGRRLAPRLAGLPLVDANGPLTRRLQPVFAQWRQARQGRVGIPYAAYLALASMGWVLQQYPGAFR